MKLPFLKNNHHLLTTPPILSKKLLPPPPTPQSSFFFLISKHLNLYILTSNTDVLSQIDQTAFSRNYSLSMWSAIQILFDYKSYFTMKTGLMLTYCKPIWLLNRDIKLLFCTQKMNHMSSDIFRAFLGIPAKQVVLERLQHTSSILIC